MDRRSPEAAAYRTQYKSARWLKLRKRQLTANPLCAWCYKRGHITPATICHHVDKDSKANAFYDGPFLSLCKPCHDSDAQSQEHRGFSLEIGKDGWPVDERHPTNRADAMRRLAQR